MISPMHNKCQCVQDPRAHYHPQLSYASIEKTIHLKDWSELKTCSGINHPVQKSENREKTCPKTGVSCNGDS
jgi:hypothetical protein